MPVLYGCETWSFALREKRRLRAFENRVLRKIFGPKRDKVTRDWTKLHNEELDNLYWTKLHNEELDNLYWTKQHNEELDNLYCSPNISRVIKSGRMRWAEHVARMGKKRGVYRVLVGKPEGKRPLGRPRCSWGIILRWIFRKWDVGVWTGSSWLRIGTRSRHLWMR